MAVVVHCVQNVPCDSKRVSNAPRLELAVIAEVAAGRRRRR